MAALIKVEKLWKEYRTINNIVVALKDVSLEIEEKRFCVLFGPSGSGKTTFLNLIGLIDVPTKGKIFLDGTDTAKMHRGSSADFRLNNIGFIFQKYYLVEELSALDNVFLPAVAKDGFSHKITERAKYLLDLVGLKHRIKHKPRHLSEGEKQRVAIARSLINEPKILLCDEPTASLDSQNGETILDLLTKINKEKGVTVFLVTHDERHLGLGNKIFHISDGMITKTTDK